MKVLILNGSPRKNGNTFHALEAVRKGILKSHPDAEIATVRAVELRLKGCIACDGCRKNGGECVLPDGGAEIMKQVAAADLVIFGSPVYWWGISGQLKLVLDKFYSKDELFHSMKKRLGIVAVGAAETTDPEYELISRQFQCICEFLGWDLVLDQSIAAEGVNALAGNAAELSVLESAGAKL